MSATDPGATQKQLLDALNSGDVEAAVACYEPAGVIAPEPTKRVEGHAAVRSMMEGFLAQRPTIASQESQVVEAGDLALVRSGLTVTTDEGEGQVREMKVVPTLLMRRQADGRWLIVIDWPFPAPE